QSGRRHGAGETHADRDVVLEHPLGKETTPLGQPPGVVGEKRVLDELGHRFLAGDRFRTDALAAQILVLRHRVACPIGAIARYARVRRSRASTIQPSASVGSSVKRKRFKSSGAIFPSPVSRSLSHCARPPTHLLL